MRCPIVILIVLFLSASLWAQESSPTHAVGADFNGDGRGDVAVGSSNGRLFLLLGQDGAKLGEPQTYLVSGQPDDLTIADFTGDGLPDLICNTGDGLALLAGNKNEGLSQAKSLDLKFRQIVSVDHGDFNADSIPDLAVANWGPDTLTLLLGKGDGTFGKPITAKLPIKPFSVTGVDLDNNGSDEAAVSLVGNKKVVLAKLAEGKLDVTGRIVFGGPIGYLTSGDFDGDGLDDLGAVGNDKFWLLTRKRGELEQTSRSAGPEALLQFGAAGDLDGDGKDELISTDLKMGRVVIPSGTPVDPGVYAWRASAADLDGDGKLEILVANVRHGTISVISEALNRPVKTNYNVDPNR
jgi:hypothetical protein